MPATADLAAMQLGHAVHRLLTEARELDYQEQAERRCKVRYPFFRAVTLIADADGHNLSAFTRDISRSGIGLLHNMRLPMGPATLAIPSEQCGLMRVRIDIVWCRPCGEGWYVSGAEFIGLADE